MMTMRLSHSQICWPMVMKTMVCKAGRREDDDTMAIRSNFDMYVERTSMVVKALRQRTTRLVLSSNHMIYHTTLKTTMITAMLSG